MEFENSEQKDIWEKAHFMLEQNKEYRAIELFKQLAEDGYWGGAYMMGHIFQQRGMRLTEGDASFYQNHVKSAEWFNKALDLESSYLAHYALSQYYYYGRGGSVNLHSAKMHLDECLKCPSFRPFETPLVHVMRAELYFEGIGEPINLEKAKLMYQKAIENDIVAGYVGLSKIEKCNKRHFSAIQFKFKALTKSIKIILTNDNKFKLAGIGGKWGNVFLSN
ncbi:MAG: hypothetical protein OEZ58_23285 [Gammaproteobacteria bacterium]|nr:hypothetical protein [Gammaproteobacteria bacterium]MDH5731918.1 hypothetical protein [Gammaproteobacteria bacterium]